MQLSEGKFALEIRVPLPIHKGREVRQFVERYGLNAFVFAGDDRTDLDAIIEITRMQRKEYLLFQLLCSIMIRCLNYWSKLILLSRKYLVWWNYFVKW